MPRMKHTVDLSEEDRTELDEEVTEPLDGWRTITVTDRRTTEEWVRFVRALVA